jgi:hypothetical protein
MDELNKLVQSGQLTEGQETVVLYARVSTKKQADAATLTGRWSDFVNMPE